MDDQDRIVDENVDNTPNEGEPIPSRILRAMDDVKRRVKEEFERDDDVVQEYEQRYYGGKRRLETSSGEGSEIGGVYTPAKAKRWGLGDTDDVNERKWAALAHGSTLLTALVALGSAGIGSLLTMLIPLFIYFAFRKRSEFVAFHALQAFTIQLVGTVGWLALLIVGTIVGVALLIVSALLILVLIGIILVPLVALTYVLFVLVSFALPLGMVIYSVIAAVETWSGHNYRIPFIARWVEHQMHTPFLAIF